MATLEDLNYKSILDMSTDEAIEHLRVIRLSRRTPVKKSTTTTTTAKKKPKPKSTDLTPEQAAALLELIGGK